MLRILWRPSRLVVGALVLLGAFGAVGAWASDLPREVAAVLVVASTALGVLRARREWHRRPRMLTVDPAGLATLDGARLATLGVHWRGPIAFVVGRDDPGRIHRLAFWPDVLDAGGRRALRLASTARNTPAVAG